MSRLDRLVGLLDTGATQSVRLTAARQLGQIAGIRVAHPSGKAHGHASVQEVKLDHDDAPQGAQDDGVWSGIEGEWDQVISIVIKILPLLQSRSYDTRSAAAAAIGAISRAVGVWDVSHSAALPPEQTDESGSEDAQTSGTLLLEQFDLAKLLSDGTILLSSSGNEYAKLSSMTAEQLEKAQKDVLGKLGLGSSEDATSIGIDVKAELANGSAPSLSTPASQAPVASTSTASPADGEDDMSGLSARERNKLKRKRKAEAKLSGSVVTIDAPPAKKRALELEPSASNGNGSNVAPVKSESVVVDPAAKAKARLGGAIEADAKAAEEHARLQVKTGEWPWKGTVERLSEGLLSDRWERRHGSALALKELLRLQRRSGGMLEGLSADVNAERHRQWCEDLTTRLLYVLALDRFGDYVSDSVIAPVRETAAQALAVLLPAMATSSVLHLQRILVAMIDQDGAPPSKGLDHRSAEAPARTSSIKYVWQVRHSGFLGLKYLVAIRPDILTLAVTPVKAESGQGLPLKDVVGAAILGLKDGDDDVKSAAAATISPVSELIEQQLPQELDVVLSTVWLCLGDLRDDLSSSVGSVMSLLTRLLASPLVLDKLRRSDQGYSLPDLIPRMYPFFRHTISSVRLAVVETITVFLNLPLADQQWVDDRIIRLLFQNLLLEERQDVRSATITAWHRVFDPASAATRFDMAWPHLPSWLSLACSPLGTKLDKALLYSATASMTGGTIAHNVDKAMIAQDLALISQDSVIKARLASADALGMMLSSVPAKGAQVAQALHGRLPDSSAFGRMIACVAVTEVAIRLQKTADDAFASIQANLLSVMESDSPSSYSETDIVLKRVENDCRVLYAAFGKQGKVPADRLPSLPSQFSFVHAQQVARSFDALAALMPKSAKKTALPNLTDLHRKLVAALGYYEELKGTHDRRYLAAVASALVALRALPAKITPLIRAITNSIKSEEDEDLQRRAASAIASLIDYASSPDSTLKNDPSDKLVKNICTFLCQDQTKTPLFAEKQQVTDAILTLVYRPAQGLSAKEAAKAAPMSDEQRSAQLVYRGSQMALAELATRFGPSILDHLPKLWSCMSEGLMTAYSGGVDAGDAMLSADSAKGQDVLDCLTVLPAVARHLKPEAHARIEPLVKTACSAAQSKFAVVRYAAAQCLAELCDIMPVAGLKDIVLDLIPLIADPLNVNRRRGVIEVISHIVELLDTKILPYVIFLVVPVLGRMSDSDDDVRLLATNTFATLVKLVPLEAGLPDPPGFSQDLLAKRDFERDFLTQLLDGNRVEEYKIPIPIEIELRKYQREGVSWLAFLAKYQLHGLLCDDMGLGKTLQSICILGSKHFERAQRHAQTGSPDSVHLPSLIVCPTTLTGHWRHEIKTYAKNLKPLIYSGNKGERERLVTSLKKYDAVIMSYEIVRNDIELLNKIDWHYCILDEGHIIKNGKAKLTKAVKTIKAVHRLILSGTPIQNNVLELWSLFDFLMPGFLGSEKMFNDRFGKPIAASRDAKSSSKEQAAGTLALEALHKQVLPFIMRRLKEDVLDDLPPKIIQDYYCELSPLQKQLYDGFANQGKSTVDGGQSQHVFQALQYLRKLVNHPALVVKPESPSYAAISAQLQAKGSTLRDTAHAPKLAALQQILNDCGIGIKAEANDVDGPSDEVASQHRVLIFCQLKQMLDIIEHDLFKAQMPSVTYMRMDGSTAASSRHAVVQTFNGDPSIDCLLLTTQVGGLGLNLTSADTVIFVEHDWNPMKDLQAMDRAHRLGQKKVVNVYRLITRGTLEEKIMGLQKFKLNIASSVVTQQNSDLSQMGTDQILDLFQVSSADDAQAAQKEKDKDRPVGQKALLEGLDELPPEEEYQELDLDAFTASLQQ